MLDARNLRGEKVSVPVDVKKPGGKSGFTLLELVIALFLISTVLAAANIFFAFGLNTCHKYRDRVEVAENLRVGSNRLARELRQATAFSCYTGVSGSRLALKNTAGDTISYHISVSGDAEAASQLIRAVNGHGNNPVARYVQSLEVEPADAGAHTRVVALTLTGEKGRSGLVSVSTTVRLRN